jgi:hypothetical protein
VFSGYFEPARGQVRHRFVPTLFPGAHCANDVGNAPCGWSLHTCSVASHLLLILAIVAVLIRIIQRRAVAPAFLEPRLVSLGTTRNDGAYRHEPGTHTYPPVVACQCAGTQSALGDGFLTQVPGTHSYWLPSQL